ncbi:MAG: (d)CMP kinase [Clostridia bacterium]|nr:(d)CMP kinase [Clostridia bacterium]MBR3593857.1 (d)CMP kinase [Clostridia bacterium]
MINVAIDGPAGAGKSSIARKVANKLGYIYVDTGALYRTVALKVAKSSLTADKVAEIEELLGVTEVGIAFVDGEQRMMLDGADVTDSIRTPEVSMLASAVSAIPAVRAYLLNTQRRLAAENNVIMDGRDIGTVVLPDAQIKIFLTASAEDRAQRRFDELIAKGMDVNYDDVLSDIKTRDYNDSHRAVAPLKPAPDSVLADTTGNEFEQSVALIESIITEKLREVK